MESQLPEEVLHAEGLQRGEDLREPGDEHGPHAAGEAPAVLRGEALEEATNTASGRWPC